MKLHSEAHPKLRLKRPCSPSTTKLDLDKQKTIATNLSSFPKWKWKGSELATFQISISNRPAVSRYVARRIKEGTSSSLVYKLRNRINR